MPPEESPWDAYLQAPPPAGGEWDAFLKPPPTGQITQEKRQGKLADVLHDQLQRTWSAEPDPEFLRKRLAREMPDLSEPERTQAEQQYRQAAPQAMIANNLEEAYQREKERRKTTTVQDVGEGVARRFPFLHMIPQAADALSVMKAGKAMEAGNPSGIDYQVLAQHRLNAEEEVAKGTGQKTLDAVSHLPAFVAEWVMLGGAGGAGREAAQGIAQRVLGVSAESLAGKAVGAAGAGLARTAVNPALSAGAVEGVSRGESIPGAFLRSARDQFIENTVFEGFHPFAKQAGDAILSRIVKGLASGLSAGEIAAGLKAVGGWEKARAGPFTRLALAKDEAEAKAALQDVVAQTVAFGGMEGFINFRGQTSARVAQLKGQGLSDNAVKDTLKREHAEVEAEPLPKTVPETLKAIEEAKREVAATRVRYPNEASGTRHPFAVQLSRQYKASLRLFRLQLRLKELQGVPGNARLPLPAAVKPVVTS